MSAKKTEYKGLLYTAVKCFLREDHGNDSQARLLLSASKR